MIKIYAQAISGGFTYLNPIFQNKILGKGIVLDVNSLYPSVMKECSLPFDFPLFFEGKYKYDKAYNLYIQRITCSFTLKENKIPTIQIKGNLEFRGNEYLENSHGQIVALTLTNIDLELFLEHYNVENLHYICGWKFKSINGLFNDYIDKWTEEKINAKKENNGGMYTLSKLMLNSLYREICIKSSSKR